MISADILKKQDPNFQDENRLVENFFTNPNSRSHLELASFYVQGHQYEKAIKLLKRAREKNLFDEALYGLYLSICLRRGEIESVVNDIVAHLDLPHGPNPEGLSVACRVALNEKRYGLARRISRIALALDPAQPWFIGCMARETLAAEGPHDDAFRAIRHILHLDPYDGYFRLRLALMESRKGNPAAAYRHALQALVSNPGSAACLTFAAFVSRGDRARSRRLLERSALVAPTSFATHYLLAKTYQDDQNADAMQRSLHNALYNMSDMVTTYAGDGGDFLEALLSTDEVMNLLAHSTVWPSRYHPPRYFEMASFERFCTLSDTDPIHAPDDASTDDASTDFSGTPGDFRRFQDFIHNIDRHGILASKIRDVFALHVPGKREKIFSHHAILADIVIDIPDFEIPSQDGAGTKYLPFGNKARLLGGGKSIRTYTAFDRNAHIITSAKPSVFINSTENYGHYINDFFTKFIAMYKYRELFKNRVIVCKKMPPYAKEMLILFGFDEWPIAEYDFDRETIIHFPETLLIGAVPYQTGISFLRSRYVEKRKKDTGSKYGRYIYLGRGSQNPGKQRVENEGEITLFLSDLGFDIIYCMNLTVEETAEAVHGADIIVCGFGAQSSNMVFAKEGTVFVELYNPLIVINHWWSMGHSILHTTGIRYERVCGIPKKMSKDERETMDLLDVPCHFRTSDLAEILMPLLSP